MKHSEDSFVGQGRINIFRQAWLPAKPARATVVMAHGLGEHGGRYEHVAKALVDAGFAVHAMDHRGHGRSGGKRVFVDSWQNAITDMDVVVDFARQQRPSKPLFLLGHSMGGALSLAYTVRYQDKLDGLILSAPAVALDGAPPMIGPIAKFLSRTVPSLGMFGIDPSIVSRDPEAIADYASDPLNAHGKVPARTLAEIVRITEYLPKVLPKLTLPLLIMHGTQDKLAGLSGSQMVLGKVSSPDKTLKTWEGLYHEIFNELPEDRAAVLAELVAWIEAHLKVRAQPKTARASSARKRLSMVPY